VHQRAKFHPNRSNHCRNVAIYLFFKMTAIRCFGFVGQFRMTHKEYLAVFITVQNLVGITSLDNTKV